MTTLNQVKAHRIHLKAKRHPIKVGEAQHARDSREEVYRENLLIIDSLIGEMFFTDRGRENIFTILKGLFPVDRKTESVIPSKHVIEFHTS